MVLIINMTESLYKCCPANPKPRFIYIPSDRHTNIIQYDTTHSSRTEFDLSNTITHSFIDVGLCLLNNGLLILSGGGRYPNYHSTTYLFNPNTANCIRLANMNVAKSKHTLIMYGNCVYSFGGNNGSYIKTVEKYELFKNRWVKLKDMAHARLYCSCVAVEDQIFIWGGDYTKSVEIFNVKYQRCRLSNLTSINIIVNSFLKDDKIHILSKKHLQIFDKYLHLIDSRPIAQTVPTWTKSNILILSDSLIAYNEDNNSIETFNMSSLEVSNSRSL